MGKAKRNGSFEERRDKAIVRNQQVVGDIKLLTDWSVKMAEQLESKAEILIAAGHLEKELKLTWISDELDRITKLTFGQNEPPPQVSK